MNTSQHLFQKVLESSGLAMSIRLPDMTLVYGNQALCELYGCSLEEIKQFSPKEVLPPTTYNLYIDTVLPLVQSGKSWEGGYTLRMKSGRLRSVWVRLDPVFDGQGELINIVSVMRDDSDSQRLRNALKQAELHLKFLTENTSDCLFRVRLSDDHYDYISPAIESISGYPPQSLYENPFLLHEIAPYEWQQILKAWLAEIKQGKNRYEYEFPILHKNGEIHWINQRMTLVKNDSNEPIAFEGILTDVTARKQAEEELEVARNSLKFINDAISDIFFRFSIVDLCFEYLSPSVERFSGYRESDFHADLDVAYAIIPPSWLGWFSEVMDEIKRGIVRPDYVHEFIHKSGELRWARVRIAMIYDAAGNPLAIEGIAADCTAAKRAEIALKESESRYRLIIETMEDVIWTMDNNFKYVYISPAICNLTGFTPEDYLGMSLSDTMPPASLKIFSQAYQDRTKEVTLGGENPTCRFQVERYCKDGTTVWVETLSRCLFDSHGEKIGYLEITRDIRQKRQAELAIKENEERFRTLFEESPISLWEQDMSKFKKYVDRLKANGVIDFNAYFEAHEDELKHCVEMVDIVAVNKATLDLLRAASKAELIENLDKIVTKNSLAALKEEMLLLASGGSEYCGEITHRTLSGEIIWVVVNFHVPPEYQDSLSRVIVSWIDVTPRKRAEEALMESEERYRIVVENAQEGVLVVRDGTVVFSNEAMSEIVGYSAQDLRQSGPFAMVHADDRASVIQKFDEPHEGMGEDVLTSIRLMTVRGETKWVTIAMKGITWNGKKALLVIMTDITSHKMLERELRLAHAATEDRVARRTEELSNTNSRLIEEVSERRKAQEQILTLTQQLMRIQEDERQRISRDLHDKVAQDLSSILLNMQMLLDDNVEASGDVMGRIRSVMDVAQGAVQDVRDIAYGLRPPALDQLGLTRALERHCRDVSRRTGITIDFFAAGIEHLSFDFDTEINLYRIVQEALGNVSKHSAATMATVKIVHSHPDILVRISDNGNGFNIDKRREEVTEERRMGVRSMEERARLLGGVMELQSLVGLGTRVIFRIPLSSIGRELND